MKKNIVSITSNLQTHGTRLYTLLRWKSVLISLIAVLSILPNLLLADNNHAAAYLRMGVGARTIAMGNAGTATTSDVTAAYWNPAGLMSLKDIEMASLYNVSMNLDRSYQYAAIGQRYSVGSFALSWIGTSVNDIEGYDETDNPTGYFNNYEHNIALSYANQYRLLSYGITPKLYMSSIDSEMKSGFGLDLGVKYDVNQYLVAGLMVRDLLGNLAGDRIPYQCSIGLATFPFSGITIAADMVKEQGLDLSFNIGAEYWASITKDPEANSKLTVVEIKERSTWEDILTDTQTGLRIGFNNGLFACGTGLRFRNLQLDYTFKLNNSEIFNDDHLLSLIIRF